MKDSLLTGFLPEESMSVQTSTDATSYDGKGFSTFGAFIIFAAYRLLTGYIGFEYEPGRDGHITWAINGSQTWQLNSVAMG